MNVFILLFSSRNKSITDYMDQAYIYNQHFSVWKILFGNQIVIRYIMPCPTLRILTVTLHGGAAQVISGLIVTLNHLKKCNSVWHWCIFFWNAKSSRNVYKGLQTFYLCSRGIHQTYGITMKKKDTVHSKISMIIPNIGLDLHNNFHLTIQYSCVHIRKHSTLFIQHFLAKILA